MRRVTLPQIRRAAAAVAGVPERALATPAGVGAGARGDRRAMDARAAAFLVGRAMGYSLRQIGTAFGGRSNTAVFSASKLACLRPGTVDLALDIARRLAAPDSGAGASGTGAQDDSGDDFGDDADRIYAAPRPPPPAPPPWATDPEIAANRAANLHRW